MDTDLVTQLVLSRGLIRPNEDMEEVILSNDALLAELGGIWRGHKEAIIALIMARIEPIQQEMIGKATPAEVIILRQAIIEVALIGDDFERYAIEHEKRQKDRAEQGVSVTENTPQPPTEDNSAPAEANDTSSM